MPELWAKSLNITTPASRPEPNCWPTSWTTEPRAVTCPLVVSCSARCAGSTRCRRRRGELVQLQLAKLAGRVAVEEKGFDLHLLVVRQPREEVVVASCGAALARSPCGMAPAGAGSGLLVETSRVSRMPAQDPDSPRPFRSPSARPRAARPRSPCCRCRRRPRYRNGFCLLTTVSCSTGIGQRDQEQGQAAGRGRCRARVAGRPGPLAWKRR